MQLMIELDELNQCLKKLLNEKLEIQQHSCQGEDMWGIVALSEMPLIFCDPERSVVEESRERLVAELVSTFWISMAEAQKTPAGDLPAILDDVIENSMGNVLVLEREYMRLELGRAATNAQCITVSLDNGSELTGVVQQVTDASMQFIAHASRGTERHAIVPLSRVQFVSYSLERPKKAKASKSPKPKTLSAARRKALSSVST